MSNAIPIIDTSQINTTSTTTTNEEQTNDLELKTLISIQRNAEIEFMCMLIF